MDRVPFVYNKVSFSQSGQLNNCGGKKYVGRQRKKLSKDEAFKELSKLLTDQICHGHVITK